MMGQETAGEHMNGTILTFCASASMFWTGIAAQATTNTAHLLTPANGAQVLGYPTVQFAWTSVPGVTTYVLWVGSSPATHDVLYRNTTSTSVAAAIPPGASYYARIWAQVGAAWYYEDSTFSTTPTAYLLSPSHGQTGID